MKSAFGLLISACALWHISQSLVLDSELYPFGVENGDVSLTYGDEVSAQVGLYQPIVYFGKVGHRLIIKFTVNHQ